jgi:hypothetical protein
MVKLYGVDVATALSYAIVTHEVGYIVIIVIGAYYFFHDHIKMSEIAKVSSNEDR